jgi:Rieske Fe-S protein
VEQETPNPERRKFLGAASRAAMAGGLVAGYGTFFAYAGRFLYPAHDAPKTWMFVAEVANLPEGSSYDFRTPAGASVVITRQGAGESVEDFLALSSTCPHLGCQVHWEPQNNRFFCPCHNGVFDAAGKGTGGPPGEAGQSLPEYELKVENRLLYIRVETESLAVNPGDGHDPCLEPREA